MSFVDKLGVQDEINVQLINNTLKTRKIIAVGGQPGTGKTTLFRKYMEDKQWIAGEPAKLVSASYNVELQKYEIDIEKFRELYNDKHFSSEEEIKEATKNIKENEYDFLKKQYQYGLTHRILPFSYRSCTIFQGR